MKNSPKEPSQRQLRVGEQLKHIIAETMSRGHFHDEALLNAGSITVSEVRPSPDLKHATAYITSFTDSAGLPAIIDALNEEAQMFQREIGRQINMKFTPRIRFKEDESFDEALKIESLLRDISNLGQDEDTDEETGKD